MQRRAEKIWKNKGFQKPENGRRVAVVGAGPCGLTASYYLKKCGHDVTLYEKRKRPGGYLTNGIPAFRLPQEDVQAEIDEILSTGIVLRCGEKVTDFAFLKEKYDAVLIAAGKFEIHLLFFRF